MKLKEYRKNNHLKQKDIAKLLNISQRAYSFYEKGQHNISGEFLSILADFYHTTIDDLVGRQPKNLINVNLKSNEEQFIINNLENLNKDNLLKVQTYVEFCLQDQKEKDKR